ncbi:uncharacterized protein LDX57_009085 [Aspergillus melleus]|uniref:uncharacterized protein n=1 Tax=Aspergillus melleus TaxID=138277 RepID=UPI001E8CE089|nr:uncharacterized protein LDX57_009085 [Aspergillus melleus]KAH8431424.1 hypothetical protein LDX57_009085 [Aspergillus melleus]
MHTLSTLLNCIPTSSRCCLGSHNPERIAITQHQPACAHKLSPVSRIRAAQIIRTWDALFAVEAPLRQCLAQLAPLMLCEREHRGKRGERQLLVLWWLKIMACRDSEVYWRERVDVFRELGCLEILDGGWEVEVEEEEEEEEEEERRDGPSSTSASNFNSNSASTTASTATSSSQSTSLASLPTATSTATPAAVASDDKTASNITTPLSRLLTPEQRKEHQAQHLTSIPITNPENKPNHPQFPKIGTPMSVARTIIAKHHGLDSSHVLPKFPVQGECGICLYDFRVAGGSHALFAAMFSPTIHDPDHDHEADTPGGREKKRKREIVQCEVQTQTQNQTLDKEDLWPGYDFTRWIWCKGNCGTSYHKECMGEWIHMMRTAKKPYKPSWPTCPSCRMDWIY